MGILLQMDSALFFGRFHPLVVHLPIGFLILVIVFFALSFLEGFSILRKALPITLFLGSISSIVAVVLGLLLANEGGYDHVTLAWHRWLGISVAGISTLGWMWLIDFRFKKMIFITDGENPVKNKQKYLGLMMVTLIIVVSITGHLGGNLTHGDQYLLRYSPDFLQTVFSDTGNESNARNFPEDPDSIFVFQHLIEPVLKAKCASCHDDNLTKGGLDVTTREGLLKGGDNGTVVEKGSPLSSELFNRVCLDPTSKKFMPPKGAPLSYTEIALVDFWIRHDLSFDLVITDERIPEEIKTLIEKNYSVSTARKSYVEREKVAQADESVLTSLRSQGFSVQPLAEGTNFLRVSSRDSLTKEKIETLLAIKEQVTILDLSNKGVQDDWLQLLPQLHNLTRLDLNSNPISDKSIVYLDSLHHLESVNLHHTTVTDRGLITLSSLPEIRRIYVWMSRVTQPVVDSIKNEKAGLLIDLGTPLITEEEETKR